MEKSDIYAVVIDKCTYFILSGQTQMQETNSVGGCCLLYFYRMLCSPGRQSLMVRSSSSLSRVRSMRSLMNSIASMELRSDRKRRRIHILLRMEEGSSRSSRRVLDAMMSTAGKIRLFDSLRSSWSWASGGRWRRHRRRGSCRMPARKYCMRGRGV